MYCQFFGFKERPFKLVPNPAYLYLGKSHENALGHLLYAVRNAEGFAAITGEAGTGKTTLCRMFIESLDRTAEAAYIFNPKLDAIQLLKSINQEFGLPSDAETIKELIDILNGFLMAKRLEKKQVILLIDEAQNLSKDVLEQIRLLSNLEMNADKLIQIFLVGQPELGEMLNSHELRQLAQRITLECQIRPFSFKETAAYIQHRIRIASNGAKNIFNKAAVRAIHRHTKGIPRLINVVCDRALLAAYTEHQMIVNHRLALTAIAEVSRRQYVGGSRFLNFRLKPSLLFLLLCIVLAAILYFPPVYRQSISNSVSPAIQNTVETYRQVKPDSRVQSKKHRVAVSTSGADAQLRRHIPEDNAFFLIERRTDITEDAGPPPVEKNTVAKTGTPLFEKSDYPVQQIFPSPDSDLRITPFGYIAKHVYAMTLKQVRRLAVEAIVRQWGNGKPLTAHLDDIEQDADFFRLAAKQNGLKLSRARLEWDVLKNINLPAILEIRMSGTTEPRYVTAIGAAGANLYFELGKRLPPADLNTLKNYWSGVVYIAWRDFYDYGGIIPSEASQDAVVNLKMHLNAIGFDGLDITPRYDSATRHAILRIQEKYGLRKDGVTGPFTQMALYNELPDLQIPHLDTATKYAEKALKDVES